MCHAGAATAAVAALAGAAWPAAANPLQLARTQQSSCPRVLLWRPCSVATPGHRQGQAPPRATLVLLPHRWPTPHRRHHVAKTRPRGTSAHHGLALLPVWFPRARANSSTHVLAPRTLAGARVTGAATAPRVASAHCDPAKGGGALRPRRKMLLAAKNLRSGDDLAVEE